MFTRVHKKCFLITTFIAVLLVVITNQSTNSSSQITIIGDPKILQTNYEKWKQKSFAQHGDAGFTLSLVTPSTHASSNKSKYGTVHFDLNANKLTAKLYGLTDQTPLDLWLINGASLYAPNDNTASLRRIGQFHFGPDYATLEASIADIQKQGFEIEQIVAAPSGADPLQTGVLVGSPSLFQRLYAAEKKANDTNTGFSIISTAHASVATGFPDVFNDLVTQGEDIFFNGTFEGNGRSCGSCHAAENNFTIDQPFISSLPANDPLFVAEFVPALIFGNPANLDSNGNPQRFENPALMRSFDLIVENVDGMGDLQNRFAMRGVPHNIGMAVSIDTPPNGLTPPDDRTGWSGEGAPSGVVGGIAVSGRLRDFMVGAIVQHYPLTPARSFDAPYPDFRAPTIAELDALEAFLFSLGRQQELDLDTLVLADASADAGKILFRDGSPAGSFTCNNCHRNAGANALRGGNLVNNNFNTGVELFLRNRVNDPNFTVVGEPRPVDGGFGNNPAGDFTSLEPQPGFVNENFGNQTFNTPSVVEAADTPPFFHNNIINSLEGSIRFYNSPEFIASIGRGIAFNETEVTQTANFMRVINALDNIENSALRSSDRALQALAAYPNPDAVINRILQIAIADTKDAKQVLKQGGLHNKGNGSVNAVKQLKKAIKRFRRAMNTAASDRARIKHINRAKRHLNKAVAIMRL